MNEALVPLAVGVSTVGMTNAFNLLDNMDGLSEGVALVASGVLLQSPGFVALVLLFWSRRSVPSASGAVEKVAS